ncbi:MAG TPA: hypothetical protein VN734_17210 [Acidobacteriaceae bacterium]|nr:hypothetical protein [Acidobacteriaceae bacterium]
MTYAFQQTQLEKTAHDSRVSPPPPPMTAQSVQQLCASPDVPAHIKAQAVHDFMAKSLTDKGLDPGTFMIPKERLDELTQRMQAERAMRARQLEDNLRMKIAEFHEHVGRPLMAPPPSESGAANMSFPQQWGVGVIGGINRTMGLETPPTAEELQKTALSKMNPIARDKYEPIFKLLEIQIRFVAGHWTLFKDTRTQSWQAPLGDPGCSLMTWDAMVSELLDEVARGTVSGATGPTITGQQVCGSAGHT